MVSLTTYSDNCHKPHGLCVNPPIIAYIIKNNERAIFTIFS